MAYQKPKDPMALPVIAISAVALLLAVYVLVSSLFNTIGNNSTKGVDDNSLQVAAADENIKPIGSVSTVDKSVAPKARTGEEVYNAICTGCHATGALDAPKLEKAAWEARAANGLKGLMDSAINGKGQMPAKGGDPSLTDEEIQNAILFMTGKAGLDLSGEAQASDSNTASASAEQATTDTSATAQEAPSQASVPAQEPAANADGAPVAPAAPQKAATPTAPAAPTPGQAPTPSQAPSPAQEQVATTTPTQEQAVAETPAPTQEETAPAEAAAPATAAGSVEVVATAEGEKVYKGLCFSCHDNGIAGSPKLGDKDAWAPRIATGMDALYATSLNGKGAMPAKGGNPALADEQVKAAVDYMVVNSK